MTDKDKVKGLIEEIRNEMDGPWLLEGPGEWFIDRLRSTFDIEELCPRCERPGLDLNNKAKSWDGKLCDECYAEVIGVV